MRKTSQNMHNSLQGFIEWIVENIHNVKTSADVLSIALCWSTVQR